jgi:hypothetical protein
MVVPPCSVDPDEDAVPRCRYGCGPMRNITSCIAGCKGAKWGEWWQCTNHRCQFKYLATNAVFEYMASMPDDPEPGLATVHQIARKQP